MHEIKFDDKSLPALFANRVDAIDWLDAYAERLGYYISYGVEGFDLTTFRLTGRFTGEDDFMTGKITHISGAEHFD